MNYNYLCLSLPSPALFVNGDSKEGRPRKRLTLILRFL